MNENLTVKEYYDNIVENFKLNLLNEIEKSNAFKIDTKKHYTSITDEENMIINDKSELVYELPTIYNYDNNKTYDNNKKYNLYINNKILSIDYYLYSYIGIENNKYYKYNIKSKDLLNLSDKNSISNLELFYEIEKEEINEIEFLNHIDKISNDLAHNKFEKMGLNIKKLSEIISLENNLLKSLRSSILEYIYDNHKNEILKMKTDLYNNLSLEEFKFQFLKDNIKLHEDYLSPKLINFFVKFVENKISNNMTFENLKEIVNFSINNFSSFVNLHKLEIEKLFNESIANNFFNNTSIEDDVSKIHYNLKHKVKQETIIKDKSLFSNNVDIDNEWNLLKGFFYENSLNNDLAVTKYMTQGFNHTKKVEIKGNIYIVDFENKNINIDFSNKEVSERYEENLKSKVNLLKQSIVYENASKDDKRLLLKEIKDDSVKPESLLKVINYTQEDFLKSKYYLLNLIFSLNIEVFQNNFLNILNNFQNYNKDMLIEPTTNIFEITNYLNSKFPNPSKELFLDFKIIIDEVNQGRFYYDSQLIESILSKINPINIDLIKPVLFNFIENNLNKMSDFFKSKPTELNYEILQNNYFVNKLMSIASDFVKKNNVNIDENNEIETSNENNIVEVNNVVDFNNTVSCLMSNDECVIENDELF